MNLKPTARLADVASDRTLMEENLLIRKLEEWNRMAAVVGHEINNPLAAIGNLLFLMQLNPNLPADVTPIVQQAADELKRVSTLTRSTLGFFRTSPEPETVDLASSAEAVRLLLGPMLRQRGIELQIHSQGDTTVNAWGVETREALLNLVRNACEASSQKSATVTVSLEGSIDDVRVVIADKGTGIAPAILEKLFQFGVTTKDEAGRGMGLWLAKQLVSHHGGSIEVESVPGQGSRFTVIWPRQLPLSNTDQPSSADRRR